MLRSIDSSLSTVRFCCKSCTRSTTRWLTRARGIWTWSSRSACARRATTSG